MSNQIPSFSEFLAAAEPDIAHLAPQSMIFAAGATRRSAVLADVTPSGDQYAQWAFNQMISCFGLFFGHGVRHIITHAITPKQYNETTKGYREKLIAWADWVLAGPEALDGYQRRGWRVRLLGAENIPELEPAADRLRQNPSPTEAPTMWLTVTPDESAPWTSILEAVHRSGAKTQGEAIRALYGEEIPPVTLYILGGKPLIFPAVVPPLLMGQMQCYWTLRPGFILDRETVRKILYDYAYTRKTWVQDKTGRAEKVLEDRERWENAPILGLGTRLGPFWYPVPLLDSDDE